MEVIEIKEEEFERKVLKSNKKVLVDFYANWCGPCRMLGPVLEQISSKINYDIVKMDIDQNEEYARQNGVMVVPTLILFENGKEVSRKTGLLSLSELEEWLEIHD